MAGTNDKQDVFGGVDTHKDVHAAAALSVTGQLLGTARFPTTRAGLSQLLTWFTGYGADPRRRGGYRQLRLRAHAPPSVGGHPRRRGESSKSSIPSSTW